VGGSKTIWAPGAAGTAAGAAGAGSAECTDRYAPVTGLTVYTAPDLRVLSMRTTCRPMPGSKGGSALLYYTHFLDDSQGDGIPALKAAGTRAPHVIVKCPDKSYATGVFGASAEGGPHPGIQNIGLVCHDGRDDNDDRDHDHDHGDNNNGIILNGLPFRIVINIGPGQGGIDFGIGGKVRVAREATTIYADKGKREIGYLKKGASVKVRGCERGGKGWCQITQPMSGLVWGGDLK
jgi:hypothetical protein